MTDRKQREQDLETDLVGETVCVREEYAWRDDLPAREERLEIRAVWVGSDGEIAFLTRRPNGTMFETYPMLVELVEDRPAAERWAAEHGFTDGTSWINEDEEGLIELLCRSPAAREDVLPIRYPGGEERRKSVYLFEDGSAIVDLSDGWDIMDPDGSCRGPGVLGGPEGGVR